MKDNTPRTPASMGEQWVPVPVRLVDDLTRAPTVKRRLWAAAYLLIWVVTFTHARRSGSSPTLGNLEAWTASKARHRTIKAKDDALKALALWEKRTDFEPRTNQKRTAGVQVEPAASDSNEPQTNRKRTTHAGADLHPTDLQDYKTPCSPPAGDADKAVDSVDKSKAQKPDEAAAVWKQVNELRRSAGERVWGLSVARKRSLKARIKESSAEDVLLVFRWYISSPDAEWNRANWKTPADTILRAKNFMGYLEAAQEASKPAAPETEPASIHEAWERIVAGVGSEHSHKCPGDLSGWWLWPRSRDATVHASMMEALCAATGQDHPPYAWQALRDARRRGPDSFDLNKIGRAWRPAYAAARKTARTAGGDQ